MYIYYLLSLEIFYLQHYNKENYLAREFKIMKKIIVFLICFILFFLTTTTTSAADVLVFDSTNNYLGGCQLTNKSEWDLKEDINVTTFQVWYNWNQGEEKLPVKLFKDQIPFAEFEATRSSCDPYQKQWCNADFTINKLLPKGKYSTEIPNFRQCLKPGGTGAIRLYKNSDAVKKEEPSPTPTPSLIPESNTLQPTVVSSQPVSQCPCNQTVILVTAAATSAATSFLVTLLLKGIIK